MPERAVVTGATGFIGARLVRRLVEMGVEVHTIARPGGRSAHPDAPVIEDPGTAVALRDLLAPVAPSVCFHLATYFVAQHGKGDVEPLVESNVAFGTRVADALAGPAAPVFVNTGTAWQHAGGAAYQPASLYAATKQAFQDILRHYATSGGLRVVNLKLFDTYGPTDTRPKLVHLLLRAAQERTTLEMSPGEQLIDLLHVEDAVEAFLASWRAAPSAGEATFAAASGSARTLREVVALVGQVTGRELDVRFGARPYRAIEMFEPWDAGPRPPGWAPRTDLADGLAELWRVATATP